MRGSPSSTLQSQTPPPAVQAGPVEYCSAHLRHAVALSSSQEEFKPLGRVFGHGMYTNVINAEAIFASLEKATAYREWESRLDDLFNKLRVEAGEDGDNPKVIKGQTLFAFLRSFGLSRELAIRYFRGILVSFGLPCENSYKVDWAQTTIQARVFKLAVYCLRLETEHTIKTPTFDARLALSFNSFVNPATALIGDDQLADMAKVIAAAKQKDPKEYVESFKKVANGKSLGFDEFKSHVVDARLRGSSQLFRLPVQGLLRGTDFKHLDSNLSRISKFIPDIIADAAISKHPTSAATSAAISEGEDLNLSEVVRRLDRSSGVRPIAREHLENRAEIDASSRAALEQRRVRKQSEMAKATEPVVFMKPPKSDEFGPGSFQIRSDIIHCAWDVFNRLTSPATIPWGTELSSIRNLRPDVSYLVATQSKERFAVTLTRAGFVKLMEDLRKLVPAVKTILMHQPSVVDVSGPTTVFGDIHGHMNDLLYLKQQHFSKGIEGSPGTFVFCGDYVDRGCNGVEVVAVLFAMKILAPSKLILLRGNHETREMNRAGTFMDECNRKCPESQGTANELWELINSAFDYLPFGARIDKEVLCVHGGIPNAVFGANVFQRLQTLPRPRPFQFSKISDVKHEDYIALDVMWSDPAPVQYEDKEIVPPSAKHNGFLMKTQAANLRAKYPQLPSPRYCFFTSYAVEQFCKMNGISCIVRGHQAKRGGLSLHQNARVITVFSDSQDHFPEPTGGPDPAAPTTAIGWLLVENTGSGNKLHLYYAPAPKTISSLCRPYNEYVPVDFDETIKKIEPASTWHDEASSVDATTSGPPLPSSGQPARVSVGGARTTSPT